MNLRSTQRGAYPESVERLIDRFAQLPGIGRRTAERLAFWVLKADAPDALALSDAIAEVKRSIMHCEICFNLAEVQPCSVCSDARRDRGVVLVVEQPRDLIALEQTGVHRGVFHVLLGRVSPLEGIGPDDITMERLVDRVRDPSKNCGGERVREVILGLNPTLEGDGTALFIAEALAPHGVNITRLARGVPSGSQLEYASKAVLSDAIAGRQAMG